MDDLIPPLGYRRRYHAQPSGQQRFMTDQNKPDSNSIMVAIAATAVASIIVGWVTGGIFYWDNQPFVTGVIAAVIYCPMHLIVGRLVYSIVGFLTSLLEMIFKSKREGIHPSGALVIGSVWPLAILAIPILCIALVVGLFYRSLWK